MKEVFQVYRLGHVLRWWPAVVMMAICAALVWFG